MNELKEDGYSIFDYPIKEKIVYQEVVNGKAKSLTFHYGKEYDSFLSQIFDKYNNVKELAPVQKYFETGQFTGDFNEKTDGLEYICRVLKWKFKIR